MIEADVLYVVRFWVEGEATERILNWLRSKHLAEVLAEPGFLSAELCDLQERDDAGWKAYFILYRLSSVETFKAYMKSDAKNRFNREQAEYADILRAERLVGFVSNRFLA
jgi:antibiotic biosynthesis monooxygenase (ABM) superfamily enzyme